MRRLQEVKARSLSEELCKSQNGLTAGGISPPRDIWQHL